MVALAGLWGPEKPNIALNLTYRHLADSKVAFWVLADSAEKIGIGFGETAQLLSLPKGTLSASQVQALVIGDYQEEGHPRAIILSRHLDSTTSKPRYPLMRDLYQQECSEVSLVKARTGAPTTCKPPRGASLSPIAGNGLLRAPWPNTSEIRQSSLCSTAT